MIKTKKCSVALEQLDEKSLNECLQKYGLTLRMNNSAECPTADNRNIIKINSKTDKPKKRKRKKRSSEESVTGISIKRKKRRVKPLSYSDDESCDEKIELTKNTQQSASQLSQQASELEVNKTVDSKSKLKESDKVSTTSVCSSESTLEKKAVERSDLLLNHIVSPRQEDSNRVETDNCSAPNGEIEIIKVCKQSGDEPACNRKKQLTVGSEERVLEEDEYDSREDSEDDRHTIIFEEELHKDTDLEEILVEKEIISKKFSNREITNRKKQRLVKFKRKSMAGRNLAKVERKSKNKSVEASGGEEEPTEKSVECDNEEYLREVCGLVKRLHELSRIILLLQREHPRNGEMGVHFSRVINSQQENFHREIRKSQKIIIKCYEKMMSFYNDTTRVASEIGKRAALNVEDVVNVISLCIHIEGQCEAEKSRSASQPGIFPPTIPSNDLRKMISDSLIKIIKKRMSQRESGTPKQQGAKNATCAPPSQVPRQPSIDTSTAQHTSPHFSHAQHNKPLGYANHNVKPTQRPDNTASQLPTRRNAPSSDSSHCPPEDAFRNPKIPMKCKPPSRTPQSYPFATHFKNQGTGQPPQQLLNQTNPSGAVVRRPTFQKLARHQPTNPTVYGGTHIQAMRPYQATPYYNQLVGLPQRPNPPPVSSAPGNMPNLALRILVPANACSLPPNQVENNKSFNNSAKVPASLHNNVVPAVKIPNRGGVNPPKEASPGQTQCPLGTNLMVSIRVLDKNRLFATPTELPGENKPTNTTTNPAGVAQEVLDPTIPQKLTMRNSRLQAGPVLDLEVEGASDKSIKEKTACNEFNKMDREDSNSRVYVCAQNNCKNPGVRICNDCHSVIYCSESCQFKHWTTKHKRECYQLKALRE